MSANIAQTIQKVIQDLVAPDLRELKVIVSALQKEMQLRFDGTQERSDAQFRALMAAFGEFKAQSELANVRVLAALSERVAVLESRQQ